MTDPASDEPVSVERKARTISICIPTKNRPADISRCLASVQSLTVAPEQVIVVDQSTQACALPALPQLVHLHDPGLKGSAAARNRGWELCTADAILFLDDDTELEPNCLAAIIDAFERFPDAVALQCAIDLDEETHSGIESWLVPIFERGFFNCADKRGKDGVEPRRLGGAAMACRNELRVEQFDERLVGYSYGEDWEFSQRAKLYGRFCLVEDARVTHHMSAVNRFSRRQKLRDRWENYLYFYDKHRAHQIPLNRFWRLWWMLGESLKWAKNGMGFPMLGIVARGAPSPKTLSRDSSS